MAGIDNSEKAIKKLFIGRCWSYLNDNFHKFSEINKIKIAMELCKKSIPQEIEGSLTFTTMEKIKVNNRIHEFDLDKPSRTEIT